MSDPKDAHNQTQDSSAPPVRVTVDSLPPPSEEEKTERKRASRFKWGKAILEVLAFLAVVAYVCETKRTNDLTERALTAAHNNFVKDQRPWVWIETPEPFHFKVGEAPSLNIQVVDYGKTPAIVRLIVFLQLANTLDAETIRAVQQHGLGQTIIIAPGQKHLTFTTAYSSTPLVKHDYDLIASGQAHLIAGGRVAYTDLTGQKYESWFCVERLPNGSIGYCAAPELNGLK
jgi:hypothetical protein